MAGFDLAMERALALDDLVMEIAEALRYTRKLGGTHARNAELENMISRELAIGCIKKIHSDMHNPQDVNYYRHRTYSECREETVRRGQALRYMEVQELAKTALRSHGTYGGHHAWVLDFSS